MTVARCWSGAAALAGNVAARAPGRGLRRPRRMRIGVLNDHVRTVPRTHRPGHDLGRVLPGRRLRSSPQSQGFDIEILVYADHQNKPRSSAPRDRAGVVRPQRYRSSSSTCRPPRWRWRWRRSRKREEQGPHQHGRRDRGPHRQEPARRASSTGRTTPTCSARSTGGATRRQRPVGTLGTSSQPTTPSATQLQRDTSTGFVRVGGRQACWAASAVSVSGHHGLLVVPAVKRRRQPRQGAGPRATPAATR